MAEDIAPSTAADNNPRKYKIPQYQNGSVYLTSHRACYVGDDDPRENAVGIELKDIDRTEFYAGFLKSSAKVTLIPLANKRGSLPQQSHINRSPSNSSRQDSPSRAQNTSPAPRSSATWVCTICSFSNPIPNGFDPSTANARTHLPPCQACGIKPALLHVVKAALAASRSSGSATPGQAPSDTTRENSQVNANQPTKVRCPRCTFSNHPSLLQCELCGASLISVLDPRLDLARDEMRSASPGPSLVDLSLGDDDTASIKFSFRAGGEKVFHERLKTAITQRKWLVSGAPPIPRPAERERQIREAESQPKLVGIAGLEMRGQAQRKNNEQIIGNAFEDLEALMTSAKEIIELAESFSIQARESSGISAEADYVLSQSTSALGLTTTKDMLGSEALYVSELSRNLAEFLMDDAKGVLKREGGIMSLVDLWAVFNRARNGVELISPVDFEKAAQMWESLKLPIRLRKFKSGLLVVQGRDRTDDKTIASILAWLAETHTQPPPDEKAAWDWQKYGRGVTVQEAAIRFGWSIGVATEEMEMAEEKGALCREQGHDGVRFWEQWIVPDPQHTIVAQAQ